MLDNIDEDDSMEDGQRINHRHFRNFHEPEMPSRGNAGLRNLQLNNPFGRTFVIINDLDEHEHLGYINHYTLSFDQDTNVDSNSLLSKGSISVINSNKCVVSALINFS